MTKQRTLFSMFFIFFAQMVWCQPNWREIVSPAFATLSKEINDSIAWRRAEAAGLRAEMNLIVASKAFDRTLIFGPDDKYFKEGMHKNFTSAPGPMQGNFERDKEIVRLETLHILLYNSDKALFRWLDFQARLRNHPDMVLHGRWAQQWNDLPPNKRPNPKSIADCQKWVAGELACDLANASQPDDLEFGRDKVRKFNPKFLPRPWDTVSTLADGLKMPFPPEVMLASFPTNGQFAFNRTESIPGVGFAVFPHAISNQLFELLSKDMRFSARWTRAKGEVKYTAAELQLMAGQLFFNLPDLLQPEAIYRLELIAIPNDYQAPPLSQEECWQLFRGKPAKEEDQTNARIQGEVKITEWYFRAGKYEVKQKLQTMRGMVNWEQGSIEFETDEPLDPMEMFGRNYLPAPVQFELQTAGFFKFRDALNSKAAFYYLTVPKVESLENVPLNTLIVAERDHTLDAPFVRKVSLGNPDAYPNVPENRAKDLPLAGKYRAPAFKPAGLKDSLALAAPLPFITKEHFKKEKTLAFAPVKCVLYFGELQQLIAATLVMQEQVRRRMDERVQFFFELEKRRALREGKALSVTLEQLRLQELENLPAEVKILLDAKFPDVLKDFGLIYIRRYPGTEQLSTEYELKFNSK